jgi:hypothetical protein
LDQAEFYLFGVPSRRNPKGQQASLASRAGHPPEITASQRRDGVEDVAGLERFDGALAEQGTNMVAKALHDLGTVARRPR